MSVSKAVKALTLPARLVIADPRATGTLLLAVLYFPDKLRSLLPERVYEVVTSPRFVRALKAFLGLGVARTVNNKLSQYVVNNWKSNAKFIKSQEVVLITGGCSGIGLGMVEAFSRMGTKVVVMDLSPPKTSIPQGVHFYQCDVTSSSQISDAAAEIRKSVGDPTVLINNAGIGSSATILDGSEEIIRKTFEVNTIAHFLMVKEFLPAMIKKNKGHVVTIASMASFIVHAGNVDYSCTKASALAFHEGLASELKARYNAPDVRTTVVHPSWIRTPLIQRLLDHPGFKDPVIEPEVVVSRVVDQVVSGQSGQLFLPSAIGVFGYLRSWPSWLQNGFRNRIAHTLEEVKL
ncbi:Dehydrogenase RED2 [Hyphodiscus hymeniophilus]|uniref:Short-chain dehydrogenase/reductase 3 n=1 Tax=Hyphodiscus hymeniophilus TaxID=353542 RepID=A0A9P7AY40_9HELO|nr:Dehydrogenase RED2 [Hyphodiscus hymeniophilus]